MNPPVRASSTTSRTCREHPDLISQIAIAVGLEPDSNDIAGDAFMREREHALNRQYLATLQRASREVAVAVVVLARIAGTAGDRKNCGNNQPTP
jgi:hypothetical protein